MLAAAALLPAGADRYTSLATAKHLMVTTTSGATYYYIVSSMDPIVAHLADGQVVLGSDAFAPDDIKSIMVRNIEQYILDEDSITFDRNYAVEHGMLLLRRSMTVGQWNSLVIPVSLTAAQVRDAFGDETKVATLRGFRQDDYSAVDLETITPAGDSEVLIEAHKHYVVMPSREPDLAEGKRGIQLTGRPRGPIYLIPDVTQKSGTRQPSTVTSRSDDSSHSLTLRGTYTLRDGSTALTRKIFGGKNPLYLLNDEGRFEQHTDSVLVKAFTSWFADMSDTPQQLTFYVDGVSATTDQIAQMPFVPQGGDQTVYDLQGRPVARAEGGARPEGLRPGIYVHNGRKIIIR